MLDCEWGEVMVVELGFQMELEWDEVWGAL
jgi:hypothetical protein